MKLIDTHTHIYLPEFDSDRDAAVNRALENGIEKLLMPNIDISSVRRYAQHRGKISGNMPFNGGTASHICKRRLP